MLENESVGDKSLFDNDIQQCVPCLATQYVLNPNADKCQLCPPGLSCSFGHLWQPKTVGAIWKAVAGQLWLQWCPTGHKLINTTGHDNQECQKCEVGFYILDGNNPAFQCLPCPQNAVCRNGAPPMFDLVTLTMSIELQTASTDQVDLDAVKVAIAESLGLDPSDIQLQSSQGRRSSGLQISFQVTAGESETAQLQQAISTDIFASQFQKVMASQGVNVSVAAAQTTTTPSAQNKKGEVWVSGSDGRYYLRACPPGTLLVNTTADLQSCDSCPVDTYVISPYQGCGQARCDARSCVSCPIGAQCKHGHIFQPHVQGSEWEVQENSSVTPPTMNYRLSTCPPGFIVIRYFHLCYSLLRWVRNG